jgi:hypothetical protein
LSGVDKYWLQSLNVRTAMTDSRATEDQRLLQVLQNEAEFFDAGGYGRTFRSGWRPTLLLRDSPTCINYRDTGRQNSCSQCPLFPLVAADQRERLVPCHHISLNQRGETVADLYALGSQELLDQRYRNWLQEKIQGLTTS